MTQYINLNQRRRRKSKKLVTRVTKFLNSCEAKHKKSLAHHFTSSSCSTDINALHDAYGAYVQFIALSTRFVINPSMLTFVRVRLCQNVLLKCSLYFYLFFPNFSLFGRETQKEREKERGGRESSSSQVYRSQTREFTHTCYENRTIDGLEERANARCGRLRVEGARLLFACCCFSCVFARGLASGGSCVCAL